MDGHRQVDGRSERTGPTAQQTGPAGPAAMNDAAVDREIAALLAVDPSPEFLASVRARVAREPEPAAWRWSWMVVTAGAVAMVIVAVMVWPSGESVPSNDATVQRPQVAGAVETVPPRASLPVPEPARTQRTAPRAVAVASLPDRRIDIDLPDVVIAENEVRTFASLVTSIRQSRFDVPVPAVPNPDTPLEIKELPPVEPLEIEPIVRVATLQAEGVRP